MTDISTAMARFTAIWQACPQLRLGQLMSNVLTAYAYEKGSDPFYATNDDLLQFMEKQLSLKVDNK